MVRNLFLNITKLYLYKYVTTRIYQILEPIVSSNLSSLVLKLKISCLKS